MRVGIISTLYGTTNYGAILQSYALTELLCQQGYDAEQILYFKRENKFSYAYKEHGIVWIVKKVFLHCAPEITNRINRLIGKVSGENKIIEKRIEAVGFFRDTKVRQNNVVYDVNSIADCQEYDTYICGSDQVWGDSLNKGFWLDFLPEDKSKIAYAVSAAHPEAFFNVKDRIVELLSTYTAISVREKNTQEILRKILGSKVEWVLDPTMLLNRKDWELISCPEKISEDNYIFVYLLGDNRTIRDRITEFSKHTNLKIVTIPYMLNNFRLCDLKFGDERISEVSPEKWISLIRDAEYIFTDSFHGSVFSIIFHKRFYTFERNSDLDKKSMNNRIISLFELLEIEQRLIDVSTSVDELFNYSDIDYKKVDMILNRKRKESLKFLLGSLEF